MSVTRANLLCLALLAAASLAGCPRSPPDAPADAPALVICPTGSACRLLAAIDDAVIDGRAAELMQAEAQPDEVLYRLDFEGAGVDALSPVPSAERTASHDPASFAVEAGPTGHHLRIGRESAHSRALETPPIALGPGGSHLLRYRIAGRRIGWVLKGKGHRAGVEVLFFALDPAEDVAAALADPERRERARLSAEEPVRGAPVSKSRAWRRIQVGFEPPPGATHAVLRLDSGPLLAAPRAAGRGAAPVDEPEPAAWFDDLELLRTYDPVLAGSAALAHTGRHPLAVAAQAGLGGARRSSETREGIAAPAPTVLRWRVDVPPSARLQLGYGLLPGGDSQVGFEVWARQADGRVELLHDEAMSAGSDGAWSAATVDLSSRAGQRIDLELRTAGEGQAASRAAWTEVRIEPDRAGRLVVLFVFDTLAAKRTSTWGFERETTPQLSRIARQGRIYRQARAVSSWTLPSFGSLLTGRGAALHGAGQGLAGRGRSPIRADVPTLAERLRTAGWHTRAWVNNPYLDARVSGLHRGFDRYVDYGTRSRVQAGLTGIEAALAAIAEPGQGDRFLFVHLLEPHGPYRPNATWRTRFVDPGYHGRFDRGVPRGNFGRLVRDQLDLYDEDRQALQDLYAALLGWGDEQLGRVFDAAQDGGDEVLFVVASDHGEEFWEHERFEHGHSLYEELLHVPLVTWRTGGEAGEIGQPVSIEQVPGTILDFAGLSGALPALPERPGPAAAHHATGTLYGYGRRAVIQDGWKYILTHRGLGTGHVRIRQPVVRRELFDLSTDPEERHDRVETEPERAAALHERLVERALEEQPGAWLLAVRSPDDRPLRVRSRLDLEPGSGWRAGIGDFPWPGEPEAWFGWTLGGGPDRSRLDLDLTAARTLLLLTCHGPASWLEVEVTDEQGVALPRVGPAGPLEAGRIAASTVEATPAEVMALMTQQVQEPSVLLVRLPGGGLEPSDVADLPPEVLEQLRALGYAE